MSKPFALALFQPDIPQNTGTLIRTCAALSIPLHIIEPCGFVWGHQKMKRAAMDYFELADITRHLSWQDFQNWSEQENKRIVLMTTKTDQSLYNFTFAPNDILLAGRESAGVPGDVHNFCQTKLTIPQTQGRSLNVAIASALFIGEMSRQLG